jgi:hypothetical protein
MPELLPFSKSKIAKFQTVMHAVEKKKQLELGS